MQCGVMNAYLSSLLTANSSTCECHCNSPLLAVTAQNLMNDGTCSCQYSPSFAVRQPWSSYSGYASLSYAVLLCRACLTVDAHYRLFTADCTLTSLSFVVSAVGIYCIRSWSHGYHTVLAVDKLLALPRISRCS